MHPVEAFIAHGRAVNCPVWLSNACPQFGSVSTWKISPGATVNVTALPGELCE